MKYHAAILAGGLGTRMGDGLPKQFIAIDGKPVILRTLEVFAGSGLFDRIVLASHPGWTDLLHQLLAAGRLADAVQPIPGGPTRQASAYNALRALQKLAGAEDAVLIHDAARCLVTGAILERCLEALQSDRAVTTGIPVVDTIAVAPGGQIRSIPDRGDLVLIQTPQGFRLQTILEAHEAALGRGVTNATDDAQLVLDLGLPVRVVPGDRENIKISTPIDLVLAGALLARR